jgi:glyoxylase-like metal-dependent hydrolase (beta-lactamase superfamily II)
MNPSDITEGRIDRLDHGVDVIDTGFVRPGFDAAYLLVEGGQAAFIDTGTNHSVPRLLRALEGRALDPADVRWVIVTHVHLDHAGGAGLLLSRLPNARLVVHARGARHMVEPSQLWAGVCQVYGDEVARRDYGELVPVPQERVVATEDGMVLSLGGRPLRFLDTPGHARHHHCIWDEASAGCFTGDTLGLSYEALRPPGVHYALPSTTPVQFDPAALRASIERLLALRPERAYLTHYGAVEGVGRQAEMVLAQADAMVTLARTTPAPGLRDALGDLYWQTARDCGLDMDRSVFAELTATDVELNAQGLEVLLASRR